MLTGKFIDDWPVVYLIYNEGEAYIGETCSLINRFSQHLSNPVRGRLRFISIIIDDEFNKSATLDIEQSLIQLFGAEGRYSLQNLNSGQSVKHDYYQREMYVNKLPTIWRELQVKGVVSKDYLELRNSPMFKFSPYMSLTQEQNEVCLDLLSDLLKKLSTNTSGTAIVHGSAGTGKTILAINLMFMLSTLSRASRDPSRVTIGFSDEQLIVHELCEFLKDNGEIRMALVVPMASLRKTLKFVFKKTRNGLKGSMVIGPSDVVSQYLKNGGKPFDVLLVDESHRLSCRRNITNYSSFDSTCRNLGMDPQNSSQLDWIMRCSKYRILFYDSDQTIKGSDISQSQFDRSISPEHLDLWLTTQLRCKAGDEYLHYLDRVFKCRQASMESIVDYDLRMFDDVGEMVSQIRSLDCEMGLCRNVAGYSWPWKTKGLDQDEIKERGIYDIDIEGQKYVWNMSNVEWILRKDSVNEIGCIHSIQGYDLNYVGVIFGREIDYDCRSNNIVVDLSKFYDVKVKSGVGLDRVREFIINSYKVMMTRGIRGCYVYACNSGMREYLQRFIPKQS